MKNSFFMIISSFLPLAALKLFAQGNSSMAQPQIGQPQRGSSPDQGLEAFSLPSGAIAENDIPKIKNTIKQVLDKLSESKKSAEKRSDNQTIKTGILTFQEWLKKQGCVIQASTTYDLEAADKYSENIFVPSPGQLPFDIIFNMGEVKKQHRLMIFVSTIEFLRFGSLVENKSVGGVPALKNWPGSYLETRPRI